MKATIRILVSSVLCSIATEPGICQVVAKATAYQQFETQVQDNNPRTRDLKDVLQDFKRHYKVDILYFNATVDNYDVPVKDVVLADNFEKSLQNILRPLGLGYKKGKSGGYVIVEKKPALDKNKASSEFPLKGTTSTSFIK